MTSIVVACSIICEPCRNCNQSITLYVIRCCNYAKQNKILLKMNQNKTQIYKEYVSCIRNILYTKSNMQPSNRHATVNVIPILNGIHYICRFNIVCGIIKIIIMRVSQIVWFLFVCIHIESCLTFIMFDKYIQFCRSECVLKTNTLLFFFAPAYDMQQRRNKTRRCFQ